MADAPIVPVALTNVFWRNAVCNADVIANIGGARSSKSFSLAQLYLQLMYQLRGKKLGICRKTMPALRRTTYQDFIEMTKAYGVYQGAEHRLGPNTFEFNGNILTFFGVDDPEKVKSWEFNYLWLEEADQFTWEDYLLLSTRMSGKVSGEINPLTQRPFKNQIFLSLNPTAQQGWVPQMLLPRKGVEVIKSSWTDNPFLGHDYIRQLQELKELDYNKWRSMCLGEWSVRENIIYSNYDFIDDLPKNPDDTCFGLDFGFNNPSDLVRVDIKDQELYIDEMLCETRLTNPQLIDRMKLIVPTHLRQKPFYCDAAEPARIEDLRRAGFNAIPADKSVLDGIDTCKSKKFHITKGSANMQKEISNYKWRSDKNNKPLDEPVKFDDHAMDALRYAVRTHLGKPKKSVHWEVC